MLPALVETAMSRLLSFRRRINIPAPANGGSRFPILPGLPGALHLQQS
jgi:hypothetical protein